MIVYNSTKQIIHIVVRELSCAGVTLEAVHPIRPGEKIDLDRFGLKPVTDIGNEEVE